MSGSSNPPPLVIGLAPVVTALVRRAEEEAAGIRADGRERARGSLAAAEKEATEFLEEARMEGHRAAARVAARRRAEARRRGRQEVLAARRDAVAALRSSALAGLTARFGTAEGQARARYLASLVEARVGAPATISTSGARGWEAVATSATGSAAIDLGMLVDQVMSLLADEVDGLWS